MRYFINKGTKVTAVRPDGGRKVNHELRIDLTFEERDLMEVDGNHSTLTFLYPNDGDSFNVIALMTDVTVELP